jgi:hypothetical protein
MPDVSRAAEVKTAQPSVRPLAREGMAPSSVEFAELASDEAIFGVTENTIVTNYCLT